MGPVSAFGFSVCGWVRFEARGWRGRGGDRLGHPRQCAGAGCWGWGHAGQGKAVTSAGRAVMDKGSKGKSQGHPPYLPYLPTYGHNSRAWQARAGEGMGNPTRQAGQSGAGGGAPVVVAPGRWSGSGATAGHQGWAVPRGSGAVGGPLPPGARR